MKKTIFSGALIVFILASLVSLPGPAKAADNPATSPWFTGWADKSTSAGVGSYPSIAYNPVDGLPYISYYDSVNGNLMLASPTTTASNCGDNNRWWCRIVDGNSALTGKTNGDVGGYSSIAFWKGTVGLLSTWRLGISYHDTTNDSLKVAIWTHTALNEGWTISTVSLGNSIFHPGTYTSIKFTTTGKANIAYYAYSSFSNVGYLVLASQVASGGNCGSGTSAGLWQCDSINQGNGLGVGQYASLDLGYNNTAHIAYYDAANTNLKYAHFVGATFGNCGPGLSYECLSIAGGGADAGISASITAPRSATDKPRIAYYDKTAGTLKFAIPTTSGSGGNCAGLTWQCDVIDTIGASIISHVGISMAIDANGYPIIAYENASNDPGPSILKIARPVSAIDQLIGNCGPSGGLFLTWQCDTLDNAAYGQGNVNVASYTSVAVSPNGLATIAYFETDDYNNRDSLKVAYQRVQTFLPLIKK